MRCASRQALRGAICYTGDILDGAAEIRPAYYVDLAKELEAAGAHILGVKDMAGLLKPEAARVADQGAQRGTDLPIHFHTHDTSGISAATCWPRWKPASTRSTRRWMRLSGLTSQPCLGSIVEALKGTSATPASTPARSARSPSTGRRCAPSTAFESDLKAPASEVYLHEMPGGQFTNLKEQARSLGLKTAGTRSRRPMPTSTRCSATSSR
jgi:pyruvate carboxylase